MSTKTLRKRIALGAVVALVSGLVSVAPANAALSTADAVTSIALAKVTDTPVTGSAVKVNFGALMAADWTGTTRFVAALTSFPANGNVGVLGVVDENGTTELGASDAVTTGGVVVTDPTVALYVAPTATAGNASFQFTPTVAGTYELTVWNDAGTSPDGILTSLEARSSISITVGAASDLDLGLSTAFMTEPAANGVSASSTTNAIARTAVKTSGTQVAQVKVTLLKADGTADTRAHVVTADVSGVGYVTVNTTANTDPNGTTRSETDNAAASVRYVHIEADGTSGTGTVSVYVTHSVSGVKSLLGTFSYTTYGDVAKLEVSTKNFTIGLAGGDTTGQADSSRTAADNAKGALDNTTSVPAFIVKATDASGKLANAGAAPAIVVGKTSVIASGTCALDDGAVSGESSSTNGVGYYNCSFTTAASSKSGDKDTLTIRIVDPADSTKYITTTIDVTVGGSVATETLTFNKSNYSAGEGMVITRSAKDSAGNPVADGSASPAVTFSKSVGGTNPAAGFYVAGVSASSSATANPSVFAPSTPGAFQALATSGNTAGTALTASATVSSVNDAQIASLIAKINALSKLIAKIQKKLGIK